MCSSISQVQRTLQITCQGTQLQHQTPNTSAEEYVNFFSSHSIPKAMTLDEVKEATKKDPNLQAVIQAVRAEHAVVPNQRITICRLQIHPVLQQSSERNHSE